MDEEIQNTLEAAFHEIPSDEDIKCAKRLITIRSQREGLFDLPWAELPIIQYVKSHKDIMSFDDVYRCLAFPLTKKQLQIINLILFHPEEHYMFILTGRGGTGKSTFFNIVKQLFDNDYYPLPIEEFDSQFGLSPALQYRLAGSDEMGIEISSTASIKQLVTGDAIKVENKGEMPYMVKNPQTRFLYCCNKVPHFQFDDSGIERRLLIHGRQQVIQNPDTSLSHKTYSKQELIDFALAAYLVDMKNWKEEFKAETMAYIIINTSVGRFLIEDPLGNHSYYSYVMYMEKVGEKRYTLSQYRFDAYRTMFNQYDFNFMKLREWNEQIKQGTSKEFVYDDFSLF